MANPNAGKDDSVARDGFPLPLLPTDQEIQNIALEVMQNQRQRDDLHLKMTELLFRQNAQLHNLSVFPVQFFPHHAAPQLSPSASFAPIPVQRAPRSAKWCTFCKKGSHGIRDCRKRAGACHRCGVVGHLANQCPQLGAPPPSPPSSYVQRRRPLSSQRQAFQQHRASFPPPAALGVKKRRHALCSFCGRPDHIRKECRYRLGQCLRCGASDHSLEQCPKPTSNPAHPDPAPLMDSSQPAR